MEQHGSFQGREVYRGVHGRWTLTMYLPTNVENWRWLMRLSNGDISLTIDDTYTVVESEVRSQRTFENLERITIEAAGRTESESMECCICLMEISVGSEAIRLPNPCCHIYHENCIIRWLNISNTCPLCRMTV